MAVVAMTRGHSARKRRARLRLFAHTPGELHHRQECLCHLGWLSSEPRGGLPRRLFGAPHDDSEGNVRNGVVYGEDMAGRVSAAPVPMSREETRISKI